MFGSSSPTPSYGAGTAAAVGNSGGFDPSSAALIEQLGPLHPQWQQYQAWKASQGAGAAGGGSATGPAAPQGGMQALYDMIGKMLDKGGAYNNDILTRRVESARDDMNRARASQSEQLRGQLSERGLLGQGPEMTALAGLEEQLGSTYGGQVRDIYADESARSDARLLQTMGIAAGLSGDDAQRLVDWFNAQTGRDVGMGNVANDAQRNAITRELGQGDLSQRANDLALRRDLGFGELGLNEYGMGLDYNKWQNEFGLKQDQFAFDQQRSSQLDLGDVLKQLYPDLFK